MDYSYEYVWFTPISNYLTFKVRTCNDAHVLLASTITDITSNAYEVVLGGYDNTKSDIRQGAHGPILVQVDTPNICNCDMFLSFWVRWANHVLEIGTGSVGSHFVLRLEDPTMHDIQAISVASWTTATAQYQFPKTQG